MSETDDENGDDNVVPEQPDRAINAEIAQAASPNQRNDLRMEDIRTYPLRPFRLDALQPHEASMGMEDNLLANPTCDAEADCERA